MDEILEDVGESLEGIQNIELILTSSVKGLLEEMKSQLTSFSISQIGRYAEISQNVGKSSLSELKEQEEELQQMIFEKFDSHFFCKFAVLYRNSSQDEMKETETHNQQSQSSFSSQSTSNQQESKSNEQFFSLQDLQNGCPEGVDPTKKVILSIIFLCLFTLLLPISSENLFHSTIFSHLSHHPPSLIFSFRF